MLGLKELAASSNPLLYLFMLTYSRAQGDHIIFNIIICGCFNSVYIDVVSETVKFTWATTCPCLSSH